MNSFHNTIELRGSSLYEAIQNAKTQEEKIRVLFKSNPDLLLSPVDVHEMLKTNSPITSIRRAMTNLTSDGFLIKTTQTKVGAYGMVNFLWKLRGTGQQNLFE